MRVHLKNNGYALSAEFPMTVFDMQDALDKLKYPNENSVVTFQIYEFRSMNLPSELCEKDFTADIYRLNLFAERIEKLDFAEMAALKGWLTVNLESGFDDMLMMTYGLDSVPVFPCENYEELGKFAVENDMLAELEGCPDEVIEFLDLKTVGRRMASHEDGMFIDGYYCVPSCYRPPDIAVIIGKPEHCFFRLLIAPAESVHQAQWISLPCKSEKISEMQSMICFDFQSALPQIKDDQFNDMGRIDGLNTLAEVLSELSDYEFVKLKAVMENEQIREISDTLDCIEHLSEYEFDPFVQDRSEFGQAYLAKNLPTNFDISVLESMDLYDFGSKILEQTGGEVNSYGAVSARGQSLYSAITVQQAQQLEEDFEEDYDEEFKMEMGGLNL